MRPQYCRLLFGGESYIIENPPGQSCHSHAKCGEPAKDAMFGRIPIRNRIPAKPSYCHHDRCQPNDGCRDRETQVYHETSVDPSRRIERRRSSQVSPVGKEPEIDFKSRNGDEQHDTESDLDSSVQFESSLTAHQVDAGRHDHHDGKRREENNVQH